MGRPAEPRAEFERTTLGDQHEVSPLILRARQGDQAAWEALYRAAYPRLIGFAYRRLRSMDEAAEAVSETMLRAVAHIHRFDQPEAAFTSWLIGICRHVVIDQQREKYRRRAGQLDDYASGDDAPLDNVLVDEERALVRAAFECLDPEEREVLELRVIAGMASGQVGEMLGKRAGAVRTAQMRALGRLRGMVEPYMRPR